MSNAYKSQTRSRRSSSRCPPLYPIPGQSSSVRSIRQAPRTAPTRSGPLPFPTNYSGSTVRRLPVSQPMPLWLRWLIGLHRGSVIVVFLLAIATLIVYSSTVYTQHLWSRDYHKLKGLQRQEREMIAARENMRNYIARQAERPGAGLISKTSASTIFLQPAPKRRGQPIKPPVPLVEPQPNKPLSY
ncbi:hypothetical protein [Leptothermofonsia sp. ETS-13]|uniref:hypothetical protein n=1 Tax=Leptothermofonsia sp. ETS-13 TaxID=3035696 RepID=UPI003BA17626